MPRNKCICALYVSALVTIYLIFIGGNSIQQISNASQKIGEHSQSVVDALNNVSFRYSHTDHLLMAKMPMNGRLGNELFLYASLFGLGKEFNRTTALETKTKIFSHFNISAQKVTERQNKWLLRKEKHYSKYDPSIGKFVRKNTQPVLIIGYLQSFKYFDKYSTDLRNELKFNTEHKSRVNLYLNQLKIKHRVSNPVYIGVHIRRGDMMRDELRQLGYTVATKDYIKNAAAFYRAIFGQQIIFIVVSDDHKWSRENFDPHGNVLEFADLDNKDPLLDLCLLSSCNHSIITVGTFGWWGAYLAGGRVVYYKDYPLLQTYLSRHFAKRDYYPQQWIGLR